MGRSGGGRRDDQGAAAVEFALVCVPLFLILFGIIQYGVLFYQIQGAATTVKDSAHWAAQGIDDCTTWRNRSLQRADDAGVDTTLNPSVTAAFTFPNTGDGTVTVRLEFAPAQLVTLVPVPATVARIATMDVENLPPGGKTGCP